VSSGDVFTTSTDVGIPGANLDRYTSGLSQISIGGYSDPVLGFSASLRGIDPSKRGTPSRR
jgi:hypothetical protein